MDVEKNFISLTLLLSFSIHVMGPYQILYLLDIGISLIFIGLLRSLGFAANMFGEWPSGLFGDKYGRKLSAMLGFILSGSGIILLTFSAHTLLLAIAFIISGIGNAFLTDTLEAWIVDALKESGREKDVQAVFGKVGGLTPLLGVLAGFASSGLSSINIRAPLITSGIALITAGLLSALLVKDGQIDRPKKKSMKNMILKNISFLKEKPAFMWLLLGNLLFISLFQFLIIAWQPLLVKSNFPQSFFGILYAGMIICTSIGGFLAVKLSKVNYVSVMLISTTLWSLIFILMGASNSVIIITISLFTLEILWGLSKPANIQWRNLLIPSEIRMGVLSGISTFAALAAMATNIVYGFTTGSLGVPVGFVLFGFLGIISPICYARSARLATKSNFVLDNPRSCQ